MDFYRSIEFDMCTYKVERVDISTKLVEDKIRLQINLN